MATVRDALRLNHRANLESDITQVAFAAGEEVTILEEWTDFYLIKNADGLVFNVPKEAVERQLGRAGVAHDHVGLGAAHCQTVAFGQAVDLHDGRFAVYGAVEQLAHGGPGAANRDGVARDRHVVTAVVWRDGERMLAACNRGDPFGLNLRGPGPARSMPANAGPAVEI